MIYFILKVQFKNRSIILEFNNTNHITNLINLYIEHSVRYLMKVLDYTQTWTMWRSWQSKIAENCADCGYLPFSLFSAQNTAKIWKFHAWITEAKQHFPCMDTQMLRFLNHKLQIMVKYLISFLNDIDIVAVLVYSKRSLVIIKFSNKFISYKLVIFCKYFWKYFIRTIHQWVCIWIS